MWNKPKIKAIIVYVAISITQFGLNIFTKYLKLDLKIVQYLRMVIVYRYYMYVYWVTLYKRDKNIEDH